MHRFILYIDPGTGSYLYQFAIAAVTGIIFYFSNIKKSFKTFIKRFGSRQREF